MESFNELLLKLKEVHERELEAWQMKVQELSNKKCCDTKRMEELFTRNQQMKEQQRLLTENIKTLENRLRAGLCDRCTVTQEVAKRRQQEFEVSQMQTIQHMTLLVGETNTLKKENKKLRDDLDNLREALNNSALEANPNTSPKMSPSPGPVSLIAMATGRTASNQSEDGNVGVKQETNQKVDESHSEFKRLQPASKSNFGVSNFTSPPWKTENVSHGERSSGQQPMKTGLSRSHMIGPLDQPLPIPNQPLFLKTSSPLLHSNGSPTRHTLKPPVLFRPQPIKSSPVSFPWALPESSTWASMSTQGGPTQPKHSFPKSNLTRFPNLVPTNQHGGLSHHPDHGYGPPWQKHGVFPGSVKEPTLILRVNNVVEPRECLVKSPEKKYTPPPPQSNESDSGEGIKDPCDGPLDLSDRGKSKSSQTPKHEMSEGGESAKLRIDEELMRNFVTHSKEGSPPTSPSIPRPLLEVSQDSMQAKFKMAKEYVEQTKETNGKTEESNGKKVPALTISLRPVVLESMNSTLQNQDNLSTNGESLPPAVETGCTKEKMEEREEEEAEDQDEEGHEDDQVSEPENNHSYKRKNFFAEMELDQDSDTDDKFTAIAKKVKTTVKSLKKPSS
ncbi:uncharacterized protein rbbp8l isoform X2 [Stigmatopora nigra]